MNAMPVRRVVFLARLAEIIALLNIMPLHAAAAFDGIFATLDMDASLSNGHKTVPDDWFVGLPHREVVAADFSWDQPFNPSVQTGPYRIRVTFGSRSVIAPIWDVGPWNIKDNYWDQDQNREIYGAMSGYWAANSQPQPPLPPNWDPVKFPIPPPGIGLGSLTPNQVESYRAFTESLNYSPATYNYGCDQFGRTIFTKLHLNGAGIDLSEGVFYNGLGLANNSNVSWMFTPDLPAVREIIIRQDSTVVYDLRKNISNPVNNGGLLSIVISFTETMQTLNYPVVTFGIQPRIIKGTYLS